MDITRLVGQTWAERGLVAGFAAGGEVLYAATVGGVVEMYSVRLQSALEPWRFREGGADNVTMEVCQPSLWFDALLTRAPSCLAGRARDVRVGSVHCGCMVGQ